MTAQPSAARDATVPTESAARRLLPFVLPAIVVGAGSSIALTALTVVANAIQGWVWATVPAALGVNPAAPWWIFGVLTLTGVAIGLVVTFVPGHAGPDPATIELGGPPIPVAVLPGIALAIVLALAGGVSLGPENPIIGITIGLSVALGTRLVPAIGGGAWAALAFSGTLGAMFGTPVAAALALSEAPGDPRVPLWDRLFAPLVAAGAGALTTDLLHGESFAIGTAPYLGPQLPDLLSAAIVASAAAAIGMLAILVFPLSWRFFQRLGSPFVALAAGGAILGVLGAIGGEITLFKGLAQMQELTARAGEYSAAGLAFLGAIKLVAVVIAGTSGFRGGRIFPAIFVGVAFGLAVNAFVPGIPQSLAVAASLVGILVAVTRSGWLALFLAAFLVGEAQMLPILCVAILPAWLVVTGRPEMVITPPGSPRRATMDPP
ncbi:MAG TPA: ion channel protein [Candidatus Limnocylindrales bacterium]|jgi:H+/Cl- antiporter ClcA